MIVHQTIIEHNKGVIRANGRYNTFVLLDFSLTVKAAPHECVIRTGQP